MTTLFPLLIQHSWPLLMLNGALTVWLSTNVFFNYIQAILTNPG